MSRYSLISGRFGSQPSPAADEMNPIAPPRPIMSRATNWAIKYRGPMKLIFSIPGVPSATPAHENTTCTGPPHSATALSIDAASARLTWSALMAGIVISAKSMPTTSAPASCTSCAVALPMPLAAPTTSTRLPSNRNASNIVIDLSSCMGRTGWSTGRLRERLELEELGESRLAHLAPDPGLFVTAERRVGPVVNATVDAHRPGADAARNRQRVLAVG